MGKHTKQPWSIVRGRCGPSVEIFGDGRAITEMWVRSDKETEEANARLIAAAPELLEAAQAARAILQACGEWGNPIIAHQVNIIEDAIKKAEGGE